MVPGEAERPRRRLAKAKGQIFRPRLLDPRGPVGIGKDHGWTGDSEPHEPKSVHEFLAPDKLLPQEGRWASPPCPDLLLSFVSSVTYSFHTPASLSGCLNTAERTVIPADAGIQSRGTRDATVPGPRRTVPRVYLGTSLPPGLSRLRPKTTETPFSRSTGN